jgi:alpha-glucan phosphorylase-like protein
MQEILLGIGGVRLLRALGIAPSTFHMNEGHAAFLTLELIREKMAAGKTFEEAQALTKPECIFTTHTPVEAGHDRFKPELMNYALQRYLSNQIIPFNDILALGRVTPKDTHEPFCMTVLALKLCRAANAVSELHGQVSRHMWQHLYNVPEESSSHRPHHQWHSPARLDERFRAPVLAAQAHGFPQRRMATSNSSAKNSAPTGLPPSITRISGKR